MSMSKLANTSGKYPECPEYRVSLSWDYERRSGQHWYQGQGRGVTAPQTLNVFRSSILFHQAFPRLPKKQYILVFAHLTCMPSQDKNKHHIWISNEVHILHIEGHCVCFLSKIYDVFQRWSWGNMNAKGDKELSKTVFQCK